MVSKYKARLLKNLSYSFSCLIVDCFPHPFFIYYYVMLRGLEHLALRHLPQNVIPAKSLPSTPIGGGNPLAADGCRSLPRTPDQVRGRL